MPLNNPVSTSSTPSPPPPNESTSTHVAFLDVSSISLATESDPGTPHPPGAYIEQLETDGSKQVGHQNEFGTATEFPTGPQFQSSAPGAVTSVSQSDVLKDEPGRHASFLTATEKIESTSQHNDGKQLPLGQQSPPGVGSSNNPPIVSLSHLEVDGTEAKDAGIGGFESKQLGIHKNYSILGSPPVESNPLQSSDCNFDELIKEEHRIAGKKALNRAEKALIKGEEALARVEGAAAEGKEKNPERGLTQPPLSLGQASNSNFPCSQASKPETLISSQDQIVVIGVEEAQPLASFQSNDGDDGENCGDAAGMRSQGLVPSPTGSTTTNPSDEKRFRGLGGARNEKSKNKVGLGDKVAGAFEKLIGSASHNETKKLHGKIRQHEGKEAADAVLESQSRSAQAQSEDDPSGSDAFDPHELSSLLEQKLSKASSKASTSGAADYVVREPQDLNVYRLVESGSGSESRDGDGVIGESVEVGGLVSGLSLDEGNGAAGRKLG